MAAALVALWVTPATAQANPDGSGGFPARPDSSSDSGELSTGQETAQTKSCSVYASPNGMGLDCTRGGSGDRVTLLELFNHYDVVECWHQDPRKPYDTLPPRNEKPAPIDGVEAKLKLVTCVTNVKRDATGEWVRDGGEPGVTHYLEWVHVVIYEDGAAEIEDLEDTVYPTLVLQTGPGISGQPRVNVPAYFWLTGKMSETVEAGDVRLTARLVKTEVFPRGKARPDEMVDCPNGGVQVDRKWILDHASAPRDLTIPPKVRDACSFLYTHASPDDGYPALVRAHWHVTYQEGGGAPTGLGTFAIESSQTLFVKEIQTVVVAP